jgi:hypothetical protein
MDEPLPGFTALASADDRIRLLRIALRVRRLRRRYLEGVRQLRDAAWRSTRQDARACSVTGGNSASGSTPKNSPSRFASP